MKLRLLLGLSYPVPTLVAWGHPTGIPQSLSVGTDWTCVAGLGYECSSANTAGVLILQGTTRTARRQIWSDTCRLQR